MAPPLPPGAAATQDWGQGQAGATGLWSVACQAAGSCVAAGSYKTAGGELGMAFATLSGGAWTAVQAPLPPAAKTTAQQGFINSVFCTGPGNCVAVGDYGPPGGSSQPLIETG
jgi:hypothetical protein